MDAVKFVEERNRMCDFYKAKCTGCPLEGKQCTLFRGLDIEGTVAEVEKWSAAHPRKTRQSVFLKQWPEAKIGKNGYLWVCPVGVSAAYRDANGGCAITNRFCPDCRREFWSQEAE